MEKLKNKETCICPRCKGNGYIKIPHKSVEELNKSVTMNCPQCESEGEIIHEESNFDYSGVNADKLQ